MKHWAPLSELYWANISEHPVHQSPFLLILTSPVLCSSMVRLVDQSFQSAKLECNRVQNVFCGLHFYKTKIYYHNHIFTFYIKHTQSDTINHPFMKDDWRWLVENVVQDLSQHVAMGDTVEHLDLYSKLQQTVNSWDSGTCWSRVVCLVLVSCVVSASPLLSCDDQDTGAGETESSPGTQQCWCLQTILHPDSYWSMLLPELLVQYRGPR